MAHAEVRGYLGVRHRLGATPSARAGKRSPRRAAGSIATGHIISHPYCDLYSAPRCPSASQAARPEVSFSISPSPSCLLAKACSHGLVLTSRVRTSRLVRFSAMRNQCVNALYLLCQINRSRQEAAAVDGALPLLQVHRRPQVHHISLFGWPTPLLHARRRSSSKAPHSNSSPSLSSVTSPRPPNARALSSSSTTACNSTSVSSQPHTGKNPPSTPCSYGCLTSRHTLHATWRPRKASRS